MKLNKIARRDRAKARFSIQSEGQFNNGLKPDGRNVGDYASYMARKQIEAKALGL